MLAKETIDAVVSGFLRNIAMRLALYKIPAGLRLVDELPRNTLGKIDRNKLRTMAASADEAGRPQIAIKPSQPKPVDKRRARSVARIG